MEKVPERFYNETVKHFYIMKGRHKMKLGAQLFSLRTFIQNPEDLKSTFLKVKEIGYEVVQLSGNAPMSADDILAASEAAALPIVCTHSPLDRIINDTDALIADHKRFGCPVIGLGALPKEAHGSLALANEFFKSVEAPVAKILDSGLNFAYSSLIPSRTAIVFFTIICLKNSPIGTSSAIPIGLQEQEFRPPSTCAR